MTTLAGAVITGEPLTVTAMFAGVAVPAAPPRLSIAATLMVSAAVFGSESVRVARVAFTAASAPLTVSVVVPWPLTPALPWLIADNRPLVSFSVTVKVSPVKAPVSAIDTPLTGVA